VLLKRQSALLRQVASRLAWVTAQKWKNLLMLHADALSAPEVCQNDDWFEALHTNSRTVN
jgi:hypothetical protein